ncbi:MAG TPA: hypothetical protein VJZ71_14055 [Phycisphaerae bacterium]|nr:hypothetical protein [Phycisphaerae bacterium]
MSDTASETIVIKCGCGTNMRVRASAAGKKAKCPKCGGVMTIPAMAAAPRIVRSTPAPSPEAAPSDLSDLLPIEPAPSAEPTGGMRCPQCKVLMAAGAKICISCGYNVATGKTLKTSDGSPGKVAVAAKSLGTFALGTVLSGAGAAIGGLVWFLVAWYANLSVGYVAWGIGVLAGLGMIWGHRTPSTKAGVVAAGMSALGIVGAKLAIFIVVVYSMVTGDTDNIEFQREYVKANMTEELLDERGVVAEKEREAKWDAVYEEAAVMVAAMSDDDVRAKVKVYQEQDAAEEEEGEDEEEHLASGPDETTTDESSKAASEDESMEAGEAIGSLLSLFVMSMFGLFDCLWFFLAISSAYKIGRGATVGET